MKLTFRNRILVAITAASPAMFAASTWAGSHTWQVGEVFSNASGTIQFIELQEVGGLSGETFMAGHGVRSVATGLMFTFPANIAGNTSNEHLLLGTAAFQALPGAPAVNGTIPANFFSTAGDTIQYGVAPPGNLYDTFTFGAGALPTNGKNSIQVTNFVNDTFTTGPNTPEAFLGAPGHVDACPADCDGSNNGTVDTADFLAVLAQWGTTGSCGTNIGVTQFLAVLGAWGNCL